MRFLEHQALRPGVCRHRGHQVRDPAVTACLAGYFIGYGSMHAGLPLKVVLILSSTPVAFTALIPPSIYDLDLELSNACWLTSTLALFGAPDCCSC